jgi:hypothetical protein
VVAVRERGFAPHPTRKDGQNTLPVLLTLAPAASQTVRKRIEEILGSTKTGGCLRKSRYARRERTHASGKYVAAARNLVRMAKLFCRPPGSAGA